MRHARTITVSHHNTGTSVQQTTLHDPGQPAAASCPFFAVHLYDDSRAAPCFSIAAAFLIARYAARERVMRWARRNSKFAAIDRAIAKDGFKFVTLLRLSPLFPLAASNYLYGLTSVDLMSYVAGSFIGMLPGTYAYVSAGHLGKAALMDGEGSVGVESWQVALGLGVTLLAIGYIGRLAKNAITEAESGMSDTE